MVTLSSGILAENETAECLSGSIIRTFKEGGQLLYDWRIVLERLYPSCQGLLDMILQLQALTLAKLANGGMVSTDTCNTAHKTRRLLCKAIRMVAIEQELREESINIMENDYWNHLCNVWFGAVIKELSSHSDEVLQDNLSEIHPILQVTTDLSNIFRAIEKFFGETANYAKGLGSMYYDYMHTYNPKAHHYQIARALGGTRQDVGSEGAMAAFMNIPFFVEFLDWRLSCGTGDGILMKNLLIILQSVKMMVMFRVLSILHIAICIPTRWLAGKTQELAGFQFGVRDMGWTVDLMEEAFE